MTSPTLLKPSIDLDYIGKWLVPLTDIEKGRADSEKDGTANRLKSAELQKPQAKAGV